MAFSKTQDVVEFEIWRAIRENVGGVRDVFVWVASVLCLHWWHICLGGVGDMIAWMTWVVYLRGWRASVNGVSEETLT